jgi:hypothetical protein
MKTEKEETSKNRFEGKYKVIKKDGKIVDVLFLFGSWVGHRLSDILEDPSGYNYIYNYVLSPEQNFPKDFQKIVFKVAEKIREKMDDYMPDLDDEEDIPF